MNSLELLRWRSSRPSRSITRCSTWRRARRRSRLRWRTRRRQHLKEDKIAKKLTAATEEQKVLKKRVAELIAAEERAHEMLRQCEEQRKGIAGDEGLNEKISFHSSAKESAVKIQQHH